MSRRMIVKDSMDNILDCFGGADGGISFIKLKIMLTDIEKKHLEGDQCAGEILIVLHRFSNLIDVAKK